MIEKGVNTEPAVDQQLSGKAPAGSRQF